MIKTHFLRYNLVWLAFLQIGFAAFELHMTTPIMYNINFSNFLGNTALSKKYSFVYTYSNLYGLPSLKLSSWDLYLPFRNIHTCFSHQSFGNKRYQETISSVSINIALNPRLRMWGDIHLFALSIPSYGNAQSMGLSLRMRFQATRSVWWGAAFQNVGGSTIGKSNDIIPQNISVVLGFVPLEYVSTAIVWLQDISLPDYSGITAVKTTFTPSRRISITTGYMNNPVQINVGAQLSHSKLSIAYIINYHVEIERLSSFIGLDLGWDF